MRRTFLTIMTMLCLIFCCSNPITARANGDVGNHVHAYTPKYSEPAGNWTENCHVSPTTCTISVAMYRIIEVCECGEIRYTSQRVEFHSVAAHNH